jgi:RHS repeat-associated protein
MQRVDAVTGVYVQPRMVRVWLTAVLLCIVVFGVVGVSVASAESLCTDSWSGPAEGSWRTAGNWSTGKVPGSSDVACVGSGKTVDVTEGSNQAAVVQGAGAIAVSGGSLEVTGGLGGEPSSIASFSLSGGTLSGSATLNVSASFSWSGFGSTMSGTGATVLKAGATGSIAFAASSQGSLNGRTLTNEGTLTFSEQRLLLSEGAQIKNTGTFRANTQSGEPRFLYYPETGPEPKIINTGTFEKNEGTGSTIVGIYLENHGVVKTHTGQLWFSRGGSSNSAAEWAGLEGTLIDFGGGSFALTGSTWSGPVAVANSATVTANEMHGSPSEVSVQSHGVLGLENSTLSLKSLSLSSGSLSLPSSATITAGSFATNAGAVSGAGAILVTEELSMSEFGVELAGAGKIVIEPGAKAAMAMVNGSETATLSGGYQIDNEGTFKEIDGRFLLSEGAKIVNDGTLDVENNSAEHRIFWFYPEVGAAPKIVNAGTFAKPASTNTIEVAVNFENLGVVREEVGHFAFFFPLFTRELSSQYGAGTTANQGSSKCGDPVTCATGNFFESQTDLSIGGRGVGLNLTRAYNSQAAAAGEHGAFGYGWTSSFSDHVVVNETAKTAVVHQADGQLINFTKTGESTFVATGGATQDTLSGTAGTGYTLTQPTQIKYSFAGSSGRLESVTDRDGNATTLGYNAEGELTTITDPVARKLTLAYTAGGLVESVTDPDGNVVKYSYEGSNLTAVFLPVPETARWKLKYNASHEITEMTDGRGGTTTNEYNGANQVTSQKDPAGHTLTFEYSPFTTKITNTNTGSVTSESFTGSYEPSSITHGYGTASATTEAFTYNEGGYITSTTDGNGHVTKYGYNAANDRTSVIDPDKNETKWTYDATHDVETTTTPKGETTTIKREAHGNPEVIERPAPASKTQTTKYKYTIHGELESVTDPLERTWKYEYDTKGDRSAETDPVGNKRTWEYDEDSQEIATVSPRGNVTEGKPAEFTTKIERDKDNRPIKITDPLGHTNKYVYDENGNIKSTTDGNSHVTTYTYNGDNQPIKVKEANGTVTETEYDGAGQVINQIDGNLNKTKYTRNALEQVTEVTDPLGRITKKEYDGAGNLKAVTDPAKRTTSYTYDPASRLTEITYSDGKTPTVKYEYDADGDRTKMTDGTGTSSYTYDQLDRLTEDKDGHGDVVKNEYDLANERTELTYPNTKSVTSAYDKDGRLEKVTDWSTNITKFTYNPDSEQAATVFPSASKDEDKYAYNDADNMTEAKMLKGSETLASLVYTRDSDGQVKKTTVKKLPGAEVTENTYDENSRMTKSGATAYEYDAANNATKLGTGAYKYDKADQLETGPSLTYTYNELGQRIKTKPSVGPATTYGYDQAGNLTSVERPKEGEVTKIEDTYGYDGAGLRASQTISGTTTYLTWDRAEALPAILSDGTNSYIYGPGGLPVEQISSGGTATYLHHDQQGSTRLLTGSTGTVTGSTTFDAYGNSTGSTGTSTTPLGYDAQYTSTDTGLIYLRNRVYDPATAQFLSVDPMEMVTRAPYNYAEDNPLNRGDATGLSSWNPFSESFWTEGNFISESPLNPIPYYEKEIESYENGCGYFASVAHGLGGAIAGSALFAGGEGADEADSAIADITFGHGARHLIGTGLDSGEVESAIQSQIGQSVSHASATGSFWGRTVVGGQTIEYRAYTLPNGTINVGTYYVVP